MIMIADISGRHGTRRFGGLGKDVRLYLSQRHDFWVCFTFCWGSYRDLSGGHFAASQERHCGDPTSGTSCGMQPADGVLHFR